MLIIRRLNLLACSAQVSAFFEPSIQSVVDSIRDNFRRRLPVNSVRMFGYPYTVLD